MAKRITQKKQLTVAEILGGKPLGVVTSERKRKHVASITGIAREAKGSDGKFGPQVNFKGDFMGWDTEKPDVILRAPSMFLPGVMSDLLEQQLLGARNAHERAVNKGDVTNAEPPEVVFGFKVFLKFDEKSATGYQYEAEPLMEMTTADPAMRLLEDLGIKDVKSV